MNKVIAVFLLLLSLIVLSAVFFYEHKIKPLKFIGITRAHAHEHAPNESPEQARVVEFYRTWKRLPYRTIYCCYSAGAQQDCFPVLAQRRRNDNGEIEVMPDVTGAHTMAQASYGSKWYAVPVSVQENQSSEAGRESPDGRSHVCVNGTSVVCYVAGYGG